MASSSQRAVSQQEALTLLLLADLRHLWPSLKPDNLAGSYPGWLQAVTALIVKYGQASQATAARYYATVRADAGIIGRFTPARVDPPPLEQISRSFGWATKGLQVAEPDVAVVETLTEGVAQRLVVDQGRNALITAIESDRRCRGWAREARPGACSFCAMLSTRGAVYKTRDTATFVKNSQNRYHDHCHCVPVPLFADHYEPPAHVREWERIYVDSTSGLSGADARNAFRVALGR